MRKTEVLGISLTDYTIREAMKLVDSFFQNGKVSTIGIVTMKGLMTAQNNALAKEWMNSLDLTVPQDSEILRAGDIASHNRVKEVENAMFAAELLKKAARQNKKLFLLSDTQTNLEKLKEDLAYSNEALRITGGFSMDSTDHDGDFVVNEINAAFSDILISNLESPVKESFFQENHMKLNVAVWLMVGADTGLLKEKNGIFRKLHDRMVKKAFSFRTNFFRERNDGEDLL